MAVYFSVTTTITDRFSNIFLSERVESKHKPQNTSEFLKSKDVYVDWFESFELANKFIEEQKADI